MTATPEELCFLFTDLVGSTRLWEYQPERMARALERHDELIGDAITGARGRVFKWTGDGCCASFEEAGGALRAAIDIQQRLSDEPWDVEGGLTVRIALHRGPVQARGDDYFGTTLNRTARLLALCAGNQILATEEVARDGQASGIAFSPLGRQALRDLIVPIEVFEVLHGENPPPREPDTGIYVRSLGFHGRSREIAEIVDLFEAGVRSVTLTGVGGIGKSRLAAEVSAALEGFFREPPLWLDCSSATADSLLPTMLRTAGLIGEGPANYDDETVERLGDRHGLIVLDEFDGLAEEVGLLDPLLARSGLRFLITSRARLKTSWETVYVVTGLEVQPTDGSGFPSEAVQLFIDRAARAAGSGPPPEASDAVGEIVRLVEGHPLAIELAASWTPVLAPDEIRQSIAADMASLESRFRDAPESHTSLGSVFQRSIEMLEPDLRTVLDSLSFFQGSFTVEAAREVAGATLPQLETLIDRSLVQRHGLDRFSIHPATRSLLLGGRDLQEAEVAKRHAAYYAAVLSEFEAWILSPKRSQAFQRMDTDLDDIITAWRHATTVGTLDQLEAMVRSLSDYLETRGLYSLALSLMEPPLRLVTTGHSRLGTRLAHARGAALFRLGHLEPAEHAAEAALAEARLLDLAAEQARACNLMGIVSLSRADSDAARRYLEAGLEHARAANDPPTEAVVLNNLAITDFHENRARAVELLNAATTVFAGLDDERGRASCLQNLGFAGYLSGHLERPRRQFTASLSSAEAYGDPQIQALALHALATVAVHQGRFADARALAEPCLETLERIGVSRLSWRPRLILAKVDEAAGELDRARQWAMEVLHRHSTDGDPWAVYGACFTLGDIDATDRELGSAHRHFLRAIEIGRDAGQESDPHRTCDLARVALLADRPQEATNLALEALKMAHDQLEVWSAARAHLYLAEAATHEGRWQKVFGHLTESARWGIAERGDPHLLDLLAVAARAHLRAGDFPRAASLVRYIDTHPASNASVRADVADIPPSKGAPVINGPLSNIVRSTLGDV